VGNCVLKYEKSLLSFAVRSEDYDITVWVWDTDYVMQCLKFVASFNQIWTKADVILKYLI